MGYSSSWRNSGNLEASLAKLSGALAKADRDPDERRRDKWLQPGEVGLQQNNNNDDDDDDDDDDASFWCPLSTIHHGPSVIFPMEVNGQERRRHRSDASGSGVCSDSLRRPYQQELRRRRTHARVRLSGTIISRTLERRFTACPLSMRW